MQTGNTIVRIIVTVLILYSVAAFGRAHMDLQRTQMTAEQLQTELAGLQLEKQSLQQKLEKLWEEDEISSLARERLGLVMPGEKVFYFSATD